MANLTTYTSTITVPVYASWKCHKCGEVNFAPGTLQCKREEMTSSVWASKREEAKAKAEALVQAEWIEDAYEVITDPNHHAMALCNHLTLQDHECQGCGAKPKWKRGKGYLIWCSLCIVPALISAICVLSSPTDPFFWFWFLVFGGVVAWGFLSEKNFKKRVAALPKEFTPVIGSPNTELIEYAKRRGKPIPSPVESVERVQAYGAPVRAAGAESASVPQSTSGEGGKPACCGFCRNCGAQLYTDTGFCHKCGTKIIPLKDR